jgi:hypothetical protein
MDEKPTLEQAFREIAKLRQDLVDANRQILVMQRVGGFADSKALSIRSSRIEDRIELLETDNSMLKDFVGMAADWMARHLFERHAIAETDNQPDSIFVRKIRRRLAEWADKNGLMGKRRDVAGARNDENRLRPAASQ